MYQKIEIRWRVLLMIATLVVLGTIWLLSLAESSVSAGPAAPANDDFANATLFTDPLPFGDTTDISAASFEASEPSLCSGLTHTIWYTFSPDSQTVINVDVAGTGFTVGFTVYKADTLGGITSTTNTRVAGQCQEEFDPDPHASFLAHPGLTYFFQLGSLIGTAGTIAFDVSSKGPPVPTPTPTPGGPEMAIGVVDGDCDQTTKPSKCNVPVGTTFTLSAEALVVPANGYVLAETYIQLGDDLAYDRNAALPAEEIVWPDCDAEVAFRSAFDHTLPFDPSDSLHNSQQVVAHGCITGLAPPLPVSHYTGSLVEIEVMCSNEPSSNDVRLVASGDPVASTSGSLFTEPDNTQVTPLVNDLTINCVDVAPPAVGGLALDSGLRGIAPQDSGAPWLWAALGFVVIAAMSALAIARQRFAPR